MYNALVCVLRPDVCFRVSVCDQASERVWYCYSSSKGRCKKCINTQLGARGYSTQSNTVRATIGSWICHPGESAENMNERQDGLSIKKH